MKVLENANTSYTQAVQAEAETIQIGSQEFWMITIKIMNRKKAAVPAIINDPEIVSSSWEKAKLFPSAFYSKSSIDDNHHPLPIFPRFTEQNLGNIFITAK